MNESFLSDDVWGSTKQSLPMLPRCGSCGLHRTCNTPKMAVDGRGKRKILIVGEAPGRTEDEVGRPFVGASGRELKDAMTRVGIDLRNDCWITNSARCRPPGNKLPDKAIDYCRPYLIEAIEKLQPIVIIPLGSSAVRSLIAWLWKEEVGSISRWVGWKIPSQQLNAWVLPNYHPSFLLHSEGRREQDVAKMFFERWLRRAAKCRERPWKKIPDYKSKVTTILDHETAAIEIRKLQTRGMPIAFDYETDRLKPDHKDSRIISCALSNGERTIAYPWWGKTIRATSDLLRSEVPKIGYNAKFEDRWTKKILKHNIRNWMWDGMLASHALDTRKDSKSLKFQSFVLLGQPSYDDLLKPYMKSDGCNLPNRLRDVTIENLLVYNGLDALLEWKVAKIQSKKLGMSTWQSTK